MISTDRKANADQRGKSPEEIAHDGKHVWHRPTVQRLETAPTTQGKWDTGGSTDAHE